MKHFSLRLKVFSNTNNRSRFIIIYDLETLRKVNDHFKKWEDWQDIPKQKGNL